MIVAIVVLEVPPHGHIRCFFGHSISLNVKRENTSLCRLNEIDGKRLLIVSTNQLLPTGKSDNRITTENINCKTIELFDPCRVMQ